MVRSATPVLLQQWNRASIVRRRWDGWMQLNDGPFTQGRSKVCHVIIFLVLVCYAGWFCRLKLLMPQ